MTPAPGPTASPGGEFRALLARWPTGVSVVTARDGAMDVGLTVNAFLSVSLTPPSVLVSLSTDADTTPVVERTGRFAVNLLSHRQSAVSQRFALAIPSAEKFSGIAVHRGTTGLALLDGTLGALECRVVSRVPAYDHLLFVGEVVRLEAGADATPLVFYKSRYPASSPTGEVAFGEPADPR